MLRRRATGRMLIAVQVPQNCRSLRPFQAAPGLARLAGALCSKDPPAATAELSLTARQIVAKGMLTLLRQELA